MKHICDGIFVLVKLQALGVLLYLMDFCTGIFLRFWSYLSYILQCVEVLVTTNSRILNGCFWTFAIKDFKNTKQINRIFKRIYLQTLFTDSSKTLKKTAVPSHKAYYINQNKASSVRKMKHILFVVPIGVPWK